MRSARGRARAPIQLPVRGADVEHDITWELEPEGAGTRLTLIHEGFDLDSPVGRRAYEGMKPGWPGVLDRIATVLD